MGCSRLRSDVELMNSKVDFRTMLNAPVVEAKWVFISTNEQIQLAAIAASYMTATNHYVAFFEFPALQYPYTGSTSFGSDGYIARAMGDRVATSINNALVKIQPETIVFLGLTEIESGYLRAHLPNEKIVEANAASDLSSLLHINPQFSGDLSCKPKEVTRGLVKARLEKKRLVFDDAAESLPLIYRHGGKGLIALEEDGDLHDVAAINLALSCDLDVVLLPPIEKMELKPLSRDLHEWSENASHHAYQSWKRRARIALRNIDINAYRFATFFTTGFPYGLFIGNHIPCSHVLKYLDSGVAIVNAITQEHEPTTFGSALLFSPQLFSPEETTDISAIVSRCGYRPKMLLGAEATVGNLSNFGAHYPYDLLHICSHGGEVDGYFTIQTFHDRVGKEHKLEFYEVVGFGPIREEKVLVHRKLIFHRLDEYLWMSPPLALYPKYVFEDMMKAMKEDPLDEVLRIPYKSPISLSCHIQCYSSIHQGNFDQLSGFGHPVVFNNSCASSHELAVSLINAGARCYIATLWKVGNETAKQSAIKFYQALESHGTLLLAFYDMVQSIAARKYQHIYVFWGFHFSRLPKLEQVYSDLTILPALMFTWQLWVRKAITTQDEEVKRNILPVIRFVGEQILAELDRQELDAPEDFDPSAVDEIERGLPLLVERSPFVDTNEFDV
jgi:hypothetical protein